MDDNQKSRQLKKHKQLATGLFLLMLAVYVVMSWLMQRNPAGWMGYLKAFAEAAMVGALADWFAVTALFHHPLGIPIPHTNLIENSQRSIGDNLGNFVVSNFLTPANIRPYIKKLSVAAFAAGWLSQPKNTKLLVGEITRLLNDILRKTDDRLMVRFISSKGSGLLDELELHTTLASGLEYFLKKDEHQKFITALAEKIKIFIAENEALVKERVKAQSPFFIPGFVDKQLARKISGGLVSYFDEVEHDEDHGIRKEISAQLYHFIESLKNDAKWKEEFKGLKQTLFSPEKLTEYASDLWQSLRKTLEQELASDQSALVKYLAKNIQDFADSLQTDEALQQKIDGWIQVTAYKYILKNSHNVGELISNTVGNWEGKELSRKLELEVGKDLQFIRINGTIVGGLVGLLIYTVTQLFLD